MEGMLRRCFQQLEFGSIASHLGAVTETAAVAADRMIPSLALAASEPALAATNVQPVTVVVPCFNEESSLPYLANTLAQVRAELAPRYDVRFVFVDDGSTDGTLPALHRLFDDWAGSAIIPHGTNQGITAAILTGVRAAITEIVCSIDCDCSYDPRRLGDMIPLLADGVDLVTASPYHPQGAAKNVQGWRLALSRSASRLYRVVLRQKLHTYTSCFRVYRRSAILPLEVRDAGYLGLVEVIGKLDLAGGTIVECPAVLEARLLGRSKMKVAKNVIRHLGQLVRLAWLRIRPPQVAGGAREGSFSPGAYHPATPSPAIRARGGPDTL
jgi:glycosyltransferase involved in cell wall biosynthesis